MSLLNLNTPAGQSPRSKGSSRGTQTVYCGGDKSVTITPLSSYQNTVIGSGTPEITELTTNVRYINSTSGSDISADVSKRVTIYGSSTQDLPRWKTQSEKKGWWLTAANGSLVTSSPSLSAAVAANYVFAPQTDDGEYKKASSPSSYTTFSVVTRNYVAAVPGPTTPASFKVGGILISNIPPECEGVDFVVSAYAETGASQVLISDGNDSVNEVAALWTASTGSAISSTDRTGLVSNPDLVNATQTGSTLKIQFDTSNGTALSATSLYKLVVETQEDALA